MISAHWSNHFHKSSKTNWWCHLIQMFCLNSIFSWFQSFFFVMIAEQCINDKYAAPNMSLRSAESDVGKNSSAKNRVLVSKNIVNFSAMSFCAFLISVSIFDNSLKTWFLILIYLIRRHKFFFCIICNNRFAKFQNFCFVYDLSFIFVCRVASSERNSVGIPSVWRRRNQFCDLVSIRWIGLESYFEIPFQSNNSLVFDLFFYVIQCVIYFCNLFCIIEHIK